VIGEVVLVVVLGAAVVGQRLDLGDDAAAATEPMNLITDTTNYRTIFGPRTPFVTSVGVSGSIAASALSWSLSCDIGFETVAEFIGNLSNRPAFSDSQDR
jgi:hypothetical protein